MTSIQRFQIWCPNIFGFKGGIQVYSNYFIQAIQDQFPDAQCQVFLLHDRLEDVPEEQCRTKSNTKFYCVGSFSTPWRNIIFALQIIYSCITCKPDLIITTHLNFTPIAHWIHKWLDIPYWTAAHGIEAWNIKKSTVKNALTTAHQILAVSQYTKHRLLKEQALLPSQVSILPNTVDTHRFRIQSKPEYLLQRYGLSPDQPILLTVCRLCSSEPYKSYDPVLEAIPSIRNALPNVHYVIAGKGDDRERLEQVIDDMQLQDFVTLAGFVPEEELGHHYNLCDVFVMPSQLEGFGIVYLEAMACGKPALGGNQDGAVDALCGGKLGALVDPDDIGAIAETLTQMLQGNHPTPLMGQPEALRQAVIDAYGMESFQRRLGELMRGELL